MKSEDGLVELTSQSISQLTMIALRRVGLLLPENISEEEATTMLEFAIEEMLWAKRSLGQPIATIVPRIKEESPLISFEEVPTDLITAGDKWELSSLEPIKVWGESVHVTGAVFKIGKRVLPAEDIAFFEVEPEEKVQEVSEKRDKELEEAECQVAVLTLRDAIQDVLVKKLK